MVAAGCVVATITACALRKIKATFRPKQGFPLPATTVRKLKLHAKVLDFRLLTVLFSIDDIQGLAKSREQAAPKARRDCKTLSVRKAFFTKAKVFLRVRSFNN